MVSDDRIVEMRQFIARWGSGNCWTGTLGTACAMIHELLSERQVINGIFVTRPKLVIENIRFSETKGKEIGN